MNLRFGQTTGVVALVLAAACQTGDSGVPDGPTESDGSVTDAPVAMDADAHDGGAADAASADGARDAGIDDADVVGDGGDVDGAEMDGGMFFDASTTDGGGGMDGGIVGMDGGSPTCPDYTLTTMGVAVATGTPIGADVRGSGCGDTQGDDVTFTWTAPADGTYTFDTLGSEFNTTLSVRTGGRCSGPPELACNDDSPWGVWSRLRLTMAAGETITLVIDGPRSRPTGGGYVLSITQPPAQEDDATCRDAIDNDRDGSADCGDSDCRDACTESRNECIDTLDNDLDGDVDCDDSDCAIYAVCSIVPGFMPTGDLWVVGALGTILGWDGTAMGHVWSGTTDDLAAVSGTSATDAWAVGPDAGVLHWDGTSWSTASTQSADSVIAFADDDVWIVGEDGLAHFDGAGWTVVPTPLWTGAVWSAGTGREVAGTSSADLYVAHADAEEIFDGSRIYHYDGSSWAEVPLPGGGAICPEVNSMWASQPGDLWAATGNACDIYGSFLRGGPLGLVYVGGAGAFYGWYWGVGGSAPDDVWITAVTASDNWLTNPVLHYDGVGITMRVLSSPRVVRAVSGLSPTDAWAVTSDHVYHWNGCWWIPVHDPTSATLSSLWVGGMPSSSGAPCVDPTPIGGTSSGTYYTIASGALRTIDRASGATLTIVSLSVPGVSGADSFGALAADPSLGTLYLTFRLAGVRHLGRVNGATGVVTDMGAADHVVALAFDDTGVLYGVTGGVRSSVLAILSTTDASMTVIRELGWGDIDVQGIVYDPADGLMHRALGPGVEAFHRTWSMPVFPLARATHSGLAEKIALDPTTGELVVSTRDRELYVLGPGGTRTLLSTLDHRPTGLAVVAP